MSAKVGIIGAGTIGTLFAYVLAESNEVSLLDVRSEVVAEIGARGVGLDELPPRRVFATRDPADLFASDYLFFFVKAYDTLAAARPFAGVLNPMTAIVSLQNGLGNEEAIKTALGSAVALVVGVTNEAGESAGAGRTRRTGVGATVVGSAGASIEMTQAVAGLLDRAGLAASVVYDIRPHLWGKLIANAAINPIAALLDRPNGVVVDDAHAAALAREVALESAGVARAMRISLPFSDPWEYVRTIAETSRLGQSSMSADLANRRPTEVEQINGAIVASGRRVGVQTPYNDALLRLIKAKEGFASKIG
jgi:2-dehydropantoate 2-reductase